MTQHAHCLIYCCAVLTRTLFVSERPEPKIDGLATPKPNMVQHTRQVSKD